MQSTGNSCTDVLLRGHTLVDLICSAMGRQAFITLMDADPDGSSFVSLGGWAGSPTYASSRARFMSQAKAAELLWFGSPPGLVLTPTPGFELGTGKKGGARSGRYIVGVDHLAQQHDLLLALIVLYSFECETQLHHVGWRMRTEEEMREASGREFKAGFDGVELPAADGHLRMYHWHQDDRSPNGGYHTEYQFFPRGNQTPATHVDIATENPDDFLRLVAKAFGVEPTIWNDDPKGPYGVVWVPGDDGSVIGVMARNHWKRLVPKVDLVDAQRGPH